MGRTTPCTCQFVPPDVLNRFRIDHDLPEDLREALADTLQLDAAFRRVRDESTRLSRLALSIETPQESATPPNIEIFDCRHNQTLPGVHISDPAGSPDPVARGLFDETSRLSGFYTQVFGRRSVIMTVVSSIHFGHRYGNAVWNGSQLTYGDGDGQVFLDFTAGQDVVAHEVTHGVIQHSLQLTYVNEAGGLNESLADCFGAMFRQWRRGQTSAEADWLVGAEIIGPVLRARGFSCLRDMADPAAGHCLSPQPTHYGQYRNGMDPHISSGIANLAFQTACLAAGGRSWETVGPIWFRAMTSFGPSPNMRMREFADRTRAVAGDHAPADLALAESIDSGWSRVGL